ncbi:MAG TPA: hypothetical protein VGB83_00945 [Actinomycetota bacterium]
MTRIEDWRGDPRTLERAQLREVAALSVERRVAWLLETLELARHTGALEASCRRRDAEIARRWASG